MSSDSFDDFVNPFEDQVPPQVAPDAFPEAYPEGPPPPFTETDPDAAAAGAAPTPPAAADLPPLPPGLLNYYSRYFQLSTADFKAKTLGSLSLRAERPAPDLYGPFWVTATVVMARFLGSGAFALCIDGVLHGVEPKTFQFSKLVHSTWLFYGYTLLAPAVAARLLAAPAPTAPAPTAPAPTYVDLVTAYGYANTVWVGASLLLTGVDEFSRLGGSPLAVALVEWAIVALVALKRSASFYTNFGSARALALLALDGLFCIAAKFLLY